MTFHCWATETGTVNEATPVCSSDWHPTWIPGLNREAEWAGNDAARGFAGCADQWTGCAVPFYLRARIHRRRRSCSCASHPRTLSQSRAQVCKFGSNQCQLQARGNCSAETGEEQTQWWLGGIPARNVEVSAHEPDAGGARCIHQIVAKRCVFTAARAGIQSCLGSATVGNADRISDAVRRIRSRMLGSE